MSDNYYDNLFVLNKDIPGFEVGTIFQKRVHDKERDLGNPMNGYLTNIWIEGDCQDSKDYIGWAGETHIFPGQLSENEEWFTPVQMISKRDRPKVHEVNGLLFEERS